MQKQIAKDLLSIGAVFLRPEDPFTWASGIKSPIYCDNRLTLTAPEVRTHVEEGLKVLVEQNFPECEKLMGTSTAGIAHAAIVGHLMNLPMGYVRSGAKDHGRQNQIEGKLLPGQKVVVVEDLNCAATIAKKYGYRFMIVTLDGQVINAGGSMTGGSQLRSTGMLSRQSEIKKLKR